MPYCLCSRLVRQGRQLTAVRVKTCPTARLLRPQVRSVRKPFLHVAFVVARVSDTLVAADVDAAAAAHDAADTTAAVVALSLVVVVVVICRVACLDGFGARGECVRYRLRSHHCHLTSD